jgi:hypothetical protein
MRAIEIAVIGGQHDDGARRQAETVELVEQRNDVAIDAAALRATSISGRFVFCMVDGTPFPGDMRIRAIPRGA